jgi:hypothetical protein
MDKIINHNQVYPHRFDMKIENGTDARFSNILEGGYKRASEAVLFFKEKGFLSENILKKAFFMYLSVKKDAQRTIMEKIAFSLGFKMPFVEDLQDTESKYQKIGNVEAEFEKVFAFIHEIAADELEFYLNYAAVEKDARIHSLLLMLADLAKEFLFDVKIWYINHKEANRILNFRLQEKKLPDFTIGAVLN